MTKRALLWVFVGLRVFQYGFAQDTKKKQLWLDVTNHFAVNEQFRIGGDAGIRGFVFDEEWTVLYLRPSINYALNDRLTLHGGVGLFTAFVAEAGDTFEIRPRGGVRLRWPKIGKVLLEHYVRGEERYIRREEQGDFRSFSRLRYRVGAYFPISGASLEEKGLYLPLLYEFFWVAGGDIPAMFMNHNRLVVGLGYRINSKWRIELQYTQMLFREGVGTGLVPTAHVFRIRVKG